MIDFNPDAQTLLIVVASTVSGILLRSAYSRTLASLPAEESVIFGATASAKGCIADARSADYQIIYASPGSIVSFVMYPTIQALSDQIEPQSKIWEILAPPGALHPARCSLQRKAHSPTANDNLPSGTLPNPSLNNIPHINLLYPIRFYPCLLYCMFDSYHTELGSFQSGERTVDASDGCTGGREDIDVLN